jgi:hypothetical protein
MEHDTQPKTITMSAYLFFNQEHHVLICKVHQYAISSKFLARHFLEEHDLDMTVRQEITSYGSQFQTMEASQLTYSIEKVVPVPYLSIVTAFQCQYETCKKVVGSLYTIKQHCRLEHDWKARDGDSWIETRTQSFYQGNGQRY